MHGANQAAFFKKHQVIKYEFNARNLGLKFGTKQKQEQHKTLYV